MKTATKKHVVLATTLPLLSGHSTQSFVENGPFMSRLPIEQLDVSIFDPHWLVGGLEHFFSIILGIIIPTDFIFFRGVVIPPTRWYRAGLHSMTSKAWRQFSGRGFESSSENDDTRLCWLKKIPAIAWRPGKVMSDKENWRCDQKLGGSSGL